jgi:hypothetical protein
METTYNSQNVGSLNQYFGASTSTMWMGFTGGTGGSTAAMQVSSLVSSLATACKSIRTPLFTKPFTRYESAAGLYVGNFNTMLVNGSTNQINVT